MRIAFAIKRSRVPTAATLEAARITRSRLGPVVEPGLPLFLPDCFSTRVLLAAVSFTGVFMAASFFFACFALAVAFFSAAITSPRLHGHSD